MGRRYLITGGAGFIGSNFIRYVLEHEPDSVVTNLDALTYAGIKATTEELDALGRHNFVLGDIRDAALVDRLMADHEIVVHFAAESHVDRSIDEPSLFLDTNILGTWNLVDSARRHRVDRFIHVSTDEVYGSVAEGFATEEALLEPSSPYSASKAASDLVARSYAVTFDYPVIVTRCTNNYGPYQFPEKMIPLFVTNLMDGQKVPLYGDGANERDWLYVEDHCSALHLLVDNGLAGDIYNIGANAQLSNIEVTRLILEFLEKDHGWIESVADRPGHDFRYAVDSSKLRGLGWSPAHTFDDGLASTVDWYRKRQDWWRPLKTGQP
jgi:dTDP-glucose 4,6-dehydratase